MIPADIERLANWLKSGSALIACAALLLGVLSAAAPARSIALYERIMEWFNWRVRPIDEARELRNTRALGVLLIGLSLLLCWLFVTWR